MMNHRDNHAKLMKRQGFDFIPVQFMLCPSLEEQYREKIKSELPYNEYFDFPWKDLPYIKPLNDDLSRFDIYHKNAPKDGFYVDEFGVGHRKTPSSMHMTQMFYPLGEADSIEQIEAYPLPEYNTDDFLFIKDAAGKIRDAGYASRGPVGCSIWETAWYIRGMENLMADMMTDEPIAEILLDKVTKTAIDRITLYTKGGADFLLLGDDIGMQFTVMMDPKLYREWLKPRLKQLIDTAKFINPDILIYYHSCGYIEPFIPDLIEVGVDVLNPVQPECMSFEKLHAEYAGALSFHGTIGTQTTMPFGSPEDVIATVKQNLDIAGLKGGLFPAPTHLLEPEVPWDNIMAYVKACKEYK